MQKSIILREYQADDAAHLEEIIRTTWNYDRFCSPKTARRMARLYLLNCLARQTFARVAVLDGVPVGVIMGRDNRLAPSHRFGLRLARAEGAMLCRREGRAILKTFSKIDAVDKDLLQGEGKDDPGELSFFAVHEDSRGTGIGTMLFAQLLNYMEKQKIRRFYLFTDSSCNYGFYEHQGMRRRGETVYSVPIGVDNEMRFYLYEYEDETA